MRTPLYFNTFATTSRCRGMSPLVGEAMGLEIAPDRFDVVEFGGVFAQPLDA